MHAKAIACTGGRPRRNCWEQKALLSSRIFRLDCTFSLLLHAKRPIFFMNPMKGKPMVPKTKNLNRIVVNLPAQAPFTLREVLEHERDRRLQSALRRLETALGAPLWTMPADIDWFDAHFPSGGFDGAKAPWTSVQAYQAWRNAVRRAIRRYVYTLGTSVMRIRHVQASLLSRTNAQPHFPIPAAQLLRHTNVERVRAHYANFSEAASDPKSD